MDPLGSTEARLKTSGLSSLGLIVCANKLRVCFVPTDSFQVIQSAADQPDPDYDPPLDKWIAILRSQDPD